MRNYLQVFIKFLYTGSIDYVSDQQMVEFMIIANKYLVKNIKEFKVSGKILFKGVISYVEKDIDNRIIEFENLIEQINFKKFEKDDLLKVYGKHKWMQRSPTLLKAIVLKDLESEEEKRR